MECCSALSLPLTPARLTPHVPAHMSSSPSRPQTMRDLVVESSGESLAARLISALVTDTLEATGPGAAAGGAKGPTSVGASVGAGVDEVAAALQRSCPSYFKEADRAFYQVWA